MDVLSATVKNDGLVPDKEDMDKEGFPSLWMESNCSISQLDIQGLAAVLHRVSSM